MFPPETVARDAPEHRPTLAVVLQLLRDGFRLAPRELRALLGWGMAHAIVGGGAIVLLIPVLGSLQVGRAETSMVTELIDTTLGGVGLQRTLATSLVLVVVAGTFTALVDYAHTRAADRTERRLAGRIQVEVYGVLSRAKLFGLFEHRSGHVEAVLTKFAEQAALALVRIIGAATQAASGVVLIMIAATQSLVFVGSLFVAMLVALWPVWSMLQRSNRTVLRSHRTVRDLWATMVDELRALPTIKAFGAEAESIERVAHDIARSEDEILSARARIAARRSVIQPTLLTVLCLAVYVGITRLELPLDRVTLLAVVALRLLGVMGRIISSTQPLPFLLAAYADVVSLRERGERAAEQEGGAVAPIFSKSVVIDEVSVRTPERTILERVSLAIPAGGFVAVVGESGAGKTTIARVVLGLVRPETGSIRVDGANVDGIDLRSWRRQIGYLSQDSAVAGLSIRENLALAASSATEAAMFDALRAACIEEFVRGLPAGLDTEIGETGRLISGGERQRIGLARALLRKPRLLILDEPASSIDAAAVQRVGELLAELRGRVAILLITHDAELAARADRIYRIEGGRVIDDRRTSNEPR